MALLQGAQGAQGTRGLSEETEAYLEKHRVPTLMEHLYHELLVALPSDPLAHLLKVLQAPLIRKLIIAGPPASGKGTQCELIAKKFGVIHVSTGDLLRAESKKGTPLGKQAEQYMTHGNLVPDSIVSQIVKQRCEQSDVLNHGWLMDGYPRTRAQALSMQMMGIIPNAVFVLQVPDATVMTRIEGRRTDPVTGNVYHMVTNPPPPGLEVIQRADDTADTIAQRLHLYHHHTTQVLSVYPPSMVVRIDGDRSKDDVFKEISEQIDARTESF